MLRRLIRQIARRVDGARKSRAMKRFMSRRAMVHALADTGALTLP